MTELALVVGATLTTHAQLDALHVGSVVQSNCPHPSHYTKQDNGRWQDNHSGYEWDANAFTLGSVNEIEVVVTHVGNDPADHHLDTRLPERQTV